MIPASSKCFLLLGITRKEKMTQEVKTALFSVSIKLDKLVLDKPTSINGQAKLKCKVIKKHILI